MLKPDWQAELDGQLFNLLGQLRSGQPYHQTASQARRILQQHEHELLRPQWEAIWKQHQGAAYWQLFCAVVPGEEGQALHAVLVELVRTVADNISPYHQSENTRTLDRALCDYLGRRGYDIGMGQSAYSDGPPGKLLMELSPNSRRILRFLWNRTQSTTESVYSHLYGDRRAVTPDALRKAVERLNSELIEHDAGKIQVSYNPPDVFLRFPG